MGVTLKVCSSSENTVHIFQVRHEIYLRIMTSLFATCQEIHGFQGCKSEIIVSLIQMTFVDLSQLSFG